MYISDIYKSADTYPLKPLRLLMGDAVVVAEFSVDNVKSGMKTTTKKKHQNDVRE